MDWVPGVSQAKSSWQLMCGDKQGALKTQENFTKQCPGVSQVRSLLEISLCKDGVQRAKETQRAQLGMLNGLADGLPAVGHVKGGLHYLVGDKSGGDKAMKAASHTTGVVAGGTLGLVVAGPAGAVAGGIAGGLAVDSVATGIESKVKGQFVPTGHIAGVSKIVSKAQNKENISGDVFDVVGSIVMDGMLGQSAGNSIAADAVPLELGSDVATADGLVLEGSNKQSKSQKSRKAPIFTSGGAWVPIQRPGYKIQHIPIDNIVDERLSEYDEDEVQNIVDTMLLRKPLPPLEASRVDDGPEWRIEQGLRQGLHLIEAARRLGFSHVPVVQYV